MPDFIKLPSERVEQLRTLSRNRDVPIADLIAEFVNGQIREGHLDRAIPTIDVHRTGDMIEIDFGTFKRCFGLELARAFATGLRWFGTPKAPGIPEAVTDLAQAVSGASLVGIGRRGTSVEVSGENGLKRTLAPSIARDLSGVIAEAAK